MSERLIPLLIIIQSYWNRDITIYQSVLSIHISLVLLSSRGLCGTSVGEMSLPLGEVSTTVHHLDDSAVAVEVGASTDRNTGGAKAISSLDCCGQKGRFHNPQKHRSCQIQHDSGGDVWAGRVSRAGDLSWASDHLAITIPFPEPNKFAALQIVFHREAECYSSASFGTESWWGGCCFQTNGLPLFDTL